jgi:hypothetical protein
MLIKSMSRLLWNRRSQQAGPPAGEDTVKVPSTPASRARAPTHTQLDRGISGAAVLLHIGQSFGDHEMGSILRHIRELDVIDLD